MDAAITLEQLLAAREDRAAFQRALLGGYGRPLVCLTVNTPGPVKRGAGPRRVFEAGVLAVRERLAGHILYSKLKDLPTGPEGFFVCEMPPRELKAALCRIEETHPLGRLFDLDVIDLSGAPLGREGLGLPPRGCLVCGLPGPGCARSRAHSLEDLGRAVDALLAGYTGPEGGILC